MAVQVDLANYRKIIKSHTHFNAFIIRKSTKFNFWFLLIKWYDSIIKNQSISGTPHRSSLVGTKKHVQYFRFS